MCEKTIINCCPCSKIMKAISVLLFSSPIPRQVLSGKTGTGNRGHLPETSFVLFYFFTPIFFRSSCPLTRRMNLLLSTVFAEAYARGGKSYLRRAWHRRDTGVTFATDTASTLFHRQIISLEYSSVVEGWLFARFIHLQLTVKARSVL